MCSVSMIGDGWRDQFPNRWPNYSEYQLGYNGLSKKDFDDLKKEMEELKTLLLAAKKFDEVTGQPNCEMEDKIIFIKTIAKLVGVNLSDIFKD